MSAVDPKTHQHLIELRGYVSAWQRARADELFRRIVLGSDHATLTLISHDLREVLSEFEKKRKRDLGVILDQALQRGPRYTPLADTTTESSARDLFQDYEARMNQLADKHIFQWATFYRDNCSYILKDAVQHLPAMHDYTEAEDRIQSIFAAHSEAIFTRGYSRVVERGLAHDIGITKSVRGAQQFMHVIVGLLRDQRERIPTRELASMYWDVASAMITGILIGYRSVRFADADGRDILSENLNAWIPMMGFCRGRHALRLAQSGRSIFGSSEAAVCSLLLGVDRWSSQASTPAILPKYSRVNIGLNRLDITYSVGVDRVSQDLSAAAFFDGPAEHAEDIQNAVALKMVVVAELSDDSRDWVESNCSDEVMDASDAQGQAVLFESLAQTIAASLSARSAPTGPQVLSGKLPRNYAKDFPLDDPLFRQGQFEVERHSVNRVVQALQRGIGAYVWCSVRRSGKTTSAEAIAGSTGQTLVVVQSMDHRPNSPEVNLLGARVRGALEKGNAIPETFFGELVNDCIAATTQTSAPPRKLVFIIDEYETLFELIDSFTMRDPALKAMVSLPLISQMLAFSMKNTLLFMGQRPDAHMILLAQNQLSPNVRQHAFPLFEHHPGTPSEFATLVNRILSENIRTTDSFIEAVYQETKGHPYLTVNVLVDFCDWLMASTTYQMGTEVGSPYFIQFAKERLDPVALRSSPHYRLFHKMLAEFCSERSRAQEPWLYSVTTILREIAKRHPKKLSCSVAAFDQFSKPFEDLVDTPSRQLLASAAMANFFNEVNGTVYVGIPLMARLAASATTRGLS